MLNREDGELLTRVGPGTPMGELFRRFWLPALLTSELPEPDCPPVRVRLLGENLVAFRDTKDEVGFVAENCPHRGASLFFGRNEDAGLRCVYHGWKFDTEGNCIDMPNEPAESNFKHKVNAQSYPGAKWGGLIWIYMGPKHLKAELPQFEWCTVPDSHRNVAKWLQHTNYAQASEGELDSSHVGFLHRWFDPEEAPIARRRGQNEDGVLVYQDGAPVLTVKETEYGLTYGARRKTTGGSYYWRVTQFLLPNYSLIPGPEWPRDGRCWVPMDDEQTWGFDYTYDPLRPLSEAQLQKQASGLASPPRLLPGTFKTLANRENDYRIDRDMQRAKSFTGILGIQEQDLAVVESMGPIYDRTREHLGTGDVAIIAARRMLLSLARQLQRGVEPYAASHGHLYRVRPLDIVDEAEDVGALLNKYSTKVPAGTP